MRHYTVNAMSVEVCEVYTAVVTFFVAFPCIILRCFYYTNNTEYSFNAKKYAFNNGTERHNGDFVNTYQLIFQPSFQRRPERNLEKYVSLIVYFH